MFPYPLESPSRKFSLRLLFHFILVGSINFNFTPFMFSPFFVITPTSSLIRLRVAKRTKKLLRKIRLRKNYFKTNRLLYTYRFKFSAFFLYAQKRYTKRILRLKTPIRSNKWCSNFALPSYKKSFKKRWRFLTGLAVSPMASSLRDRKRWLRKNLRIRLRRNYKYYRFYRVNLIKALDHVWTPESYTSKRLDRDKLKKIYYDNIFYFLRSRISFRRLKFFAKLIRFKFPANTRRGIYFKSYLFLNNFETRFKKSNFPLRHVYKTYRLHRKLFKILKRRNRWTKRWIQIWFKSYSNFGLRSNRQLIGYSPKLGVKIQLRKFFRMKRSVQTHRLRLLRYNHVFLRRRKRTKLKFRIRAKWRKLFTSLMIKKLRRKFFGRKMKRLLKRSYYLFGKILKKHHLVSMTRVRPLRKYQKHAKRRKFQKWFNFRIARRFRKWYLLNFINAKKSFWKNSRKFRKYRFHLTLRNKSLVIPRLSFPYRKKINWRRLMKSSKLRFFRYIPLSRTLLTRVRLKGLPTLRIRSSIHRLLKKPVLTPYHRAHFITTMSGFLLLTNTLFVNYVNKNRQQVYSIKKTLYTFAYKSDMRKHLLKKYTKWRHSTVLSRFFKKRKALRRSRFLNLVYKEMKLSVKHVDLQLNAPISNLRSLLSRRFLSPDPLIETRFFKKKKIGKRRRKIKMTQLKLRPGLIRRWRRARRALTESLNLKPRYQHNLTNFIINYKKIMNTRFLPVFEMRLFNVLIRSRLVLDQIIARKFIEGRILFVNGVCCSNPYLQLFSNDFIQLIVTMKYYIVFRWLLNNSIKTKKRIKHLSWKNSQRKRRVDKQWNQRLQKTVLPHKHLVLDTAKYLEVDFFTLSAFVLYNPFLWSDLDRYNILNVRYGILNLYNWKYIT